MTKVKKIENWLDTLIFAHNLYNACDNLNVSSKKRVAVCGVCDYIQLYNCIDYIAKMLDIEVEFEDEKTKYIYYKGVKFIEV